MLKENNIKQKKYKIKASLKYGKVFSRKGKMFLYGLLLISILFPLITVGVFISFYFERLVLTQSMTAPLIYGNVFSLFLFGILLWRIIYNNRLVKMINMWLDDSVTISATARRLDLFDKRYKPYQIEVSFIYDGKEQKHISRAGNCFTGYYKFIREKSKKIQILYSPKYDEIMILYA